MIEYDPGEWALSYMWNFKLWKGSVAPKALVWAILCSACTYVISKYVEPNVDKDIKKGLTKDLMFGFTAYSFVLGSMLVFRINQGHSRYWECITDITTARMKWCNAVSTAFAFCSTAADQQVAVFTYQQTVVRLISMLYCAALCHLEAKKLEVLDNEGIDVQSLLYLDSTPDQCEVLLQWIQRLTFNACKHGVIEAAPPLQTRIYHELGQGMFELNEVRKIRDTPFPYPYAHMVTILLVIHVVMNSFALAFVIEIDSLAVLACFLSIFAYVGAYYLAIEIECPFGSGMNDLPTKSYMQTMNRTLRTLLERNSQTPPNVEFDSSQHSVSVRTFRNSFAPMVSLETDALKQLSGVSTRESTSPVSHLVVPGPASEDQPSLDNNADAHDLLPFSAGSARLAPDCEEDTLAKLNERSACSGNSTKPGNVELVQMAKPKPALTHAGLRKAPLPQTTTSGSIDDDMQSALLVQARHSGVDK